MTNSNDQSLLPGQINLDLIPIDWPLTPLGNKKDAYVSGWQKKPFSKNDIKDELESGKCKAVGLLSGPVYNYSYGFVWVDIDGPSVYKLIEEISGKPFDSAFPNTLTILSGKDGRERKLYRLDQKKHSQFVRNKYTWHSVIQKEKLEILWKRHQGVLMGAHPETKGYFTAPGQGFEWIEKLPELPDWLLRGIIDKNEKVGAPARERIRVVNPLFALDAQMDLDTDIKKAKAATWCLPVEHVDDYDIWIMVGQVLHELDDSLLETWDQWSQQSPKYKEGECHKRWLSFTRGGGRTLGSLIHLAQQHGFKLVDETLLADPIFNSELEMNDSDNELEHISNMLQQFQAAASRPELTRKAPSRHPEKKGKPRNFSNDVIAETLVQTAQGNFRYSEKQGAFFLYNELGGVWQKQSENETKAYVKSHLSLIKSEMLPNGYGMNLINDVVEQLKLELTFEDWYDGKEHLLFTNGIYSIETNTLLPFNREMCLTQQLPYNYDPGATCEPIIQWLKETQDGNWGRVQVLRAWLRAVLLSASDIQKFVEIVGPGKSGKSTYANLAHALVGDDNAMISTLEHLEKNRFETANLFKKKLLLFNDVERYGGSVSVLKAITGRDLIRNERKFQTSSQTPFKFDGLVMITANEPIQTTDPTSGLARRRLTIPFDRPFKGSSAEQKTLIDMDDRGEPFGVFASMLPGLVNWLLQMTEAEMREYLMETTSKVEFFAKHHREQILKSNQIMDWMEHCVVFDQGESASIGLAKINKSGEGSGVYSNWTKWLYANYCEFARSSNANILGRSRFETLLMDVCVHQLDLNVYREKRTRGMRVINVACRASNSEKYKDYPSIVEVGLNKEKWKEYYGEILFRKDGPRESF